MTTLRRFLVIQALLLWQGGFLFYAAVVVPIGTEELGAFSQGRVTRHVTHVMNVIGIVAMLILAWDIRCETDRRLRRTRWILWDVMIAGLVALVLLHARIEAYIDFQSGIRDYAAFYNWHRAYLIVATIQWACATGYIAVMLRNWCAASRDA